MMSPSDMGLTPAMKMPYAASSLASSVTLWPSRSKRLTSCRVNPLRLQPLQVAPAPGPRYAVPGLQHLVDDPQQRVAHRHRRPLPAPPRRQPPVLRAQVRPLAPARRVRRLDQGHPQPPAPLGRLAAATLAGALVVPRAHPGPARQVARRRELPHLRAQPPRRRPRPPGGRPRGSSPAAPPPRRTAPAPGRSARPAGRSGPPAPRSGPAAPAAGSGGAPSPCPRNACRSAGIFARSRPLASSASASGSSWPSIIARSMARPESPSTSVATLPSLMLASSSTFWMRLATDPRSATTCARCRVRSRSSRIGCRRHEAGLEQAVLEQLGDPLAVLHVGLAARHLLDVLGVDQHQLEPPLQQVPDRLPVHAGRSPWRRGDALLGQPVGQLDQLAGHGRRRSAPARGPCPRRRRGGRRRRRCPCGRPARRSSDGAPAWRPSRADARRGTSTG